MYFMYRSAHEQMEMTECAAYSTHQPQHTTDVYKQVTTASATTEHVKLLMQQLVCLPVTHIVCNKI